VIRLSLQKLISRRRGKMDISKKLLKGYRKLLQIVSTFNLSLSISKYLVIDTNVDRKYTINEF